MKNLFPGLRKFAQDVFPTQEGLFKNLSLGQSPHTLMITCSDSRIDPSLITQADPGEIFILRNAGNIIPPYGASKGGEEAAIEFAVDGLKVKNIVICGHTHCGAMAGLMNEESLYSLPSVKDWLKHAQATKKVIMGKTKEGETIGDIPLTSVVEENVLVQINNLKTHPSVAAALVQQKIHIYGWIYHFETGSVKIYDQELKQFTCSMDVHHHYNEENHRYCL